MAALRFSLGREPSRRTLTSLCNVRPQWLADAHAALDAAVAAAYGWSANISDDGILRDLLALKQNRGVVNGEDEDPEKGDFLPGGSLVGCQGQDFCGASAAVSGNSSRLQGTVPPLTMSERARSWTSIWINGAVHPSAISPFSISASTVPPVSCMWVRDAIRHCHSKTLRIGSMAPAGDA